MAGWIVLLTGNPVHRGVLPIVMFYFSDIIDSS